MKRCSRVGLLIVGLAVLALILAACSSAGSTGAASTSPQAAAQTGGAKGSGPTVIEKKLAFTPATANAKVGDTITFKNEDTVAHDVVIDYQDLGQQAPGKSVTWQATTAGTFGYSCMNHPIMMGQIIVK